MIRVRHSRLRAAPPAARPNSREESPLSQIPVGEHAADLFFRLCCAVLEEQVNGLLMPDVQVLACQHVAENWPRQGLLSRAEHDQRCAKAHIYVLVTQVF